MREFNSQAWLAPALALALGLGSGGCGPKPSSAVPAPQPVAPLSTEEHPATAARHIEQAPALGPLSERMEKLLTSPWLDPCERKLADRRREIVAALDQRAEEILRYQPPSEPEETSPEETSKDTDRPTYRNIPLGPIQARQLTHRPTPEPDWYETTPRGWSDIVELYDSIRAEPIHSRWVSLDRQVRAILPDDDNRVLKGRNYLLDRHSGPALASLALSVQRCIESTRCTQPELSANDVQFAFANRIYNAQLSELQTAGGSHAERRARLESLAKRIQDDSWYYEFARNTYIERSGDRELSLPLIAGAFAGVTRQLEETIAAVWSKDSFRVQVRWVESPDAIFKFVVSPEANSRSSVLGSDIRLSSGVRLGSIAHEIGHVLGLPDHYYTVWRPEACGYADQVNDHDIMSSSDTGGATQDEITELLRAYRF